MKNIFNSKIQINVKGRHINRFVRRLIKNKIDILSMNIISDSEVNIITYEKNIKLIDKIKSIYEFKVVRVYGYLNLKNIMIINVHIIIICLTWFVIFKMLTNMVFSIDVIHSNKEVRNTIMSELKQEGIVKFSFKKSYDELNEIKQKILYRHKNDIEWLEIEQKGTKYIVRVLEREIPKVKENNTPQNIIAKKTAIIKKIVSSKGTIIKNINDYVNKGDIIVSGEIKLNDKVMDKVSSTGKVYGEVWYVVHTKYPFAYYNEKETRNERNRYVIKFLNHDFELSLKKYDNKKTKDKLIYKSHIIPLSISLQHQKEVKIESSILTFEEAREKAQNLAVKKINNTLSNDEYIISHKYLKGTVSNGKIEVEMFFSVYEDITGYSAINSN